MPLGPVLPGRIPDTFSVQRTDRNLNIAARELANLQQQLSTGQRYFFGSEATSDAIRTVQQQSLAERKTQAFQNTETNLSLLGAAESSLAEISNVLNSVKSVSLASIGESSTPAEREQFVTELNTLIDSAIHAANREFRGRNLFSGTQSSEPPFARLADGVAYFGDATATQSFGDLNQFILNGVDPTKAFNDDISVTTSDLDPLVTADTKLASLNGGTGVDGSKIEIRTTLGFFEVDLEGAETVGDVALRINDFFATSAQPVTATVTGTGLQLTPTSGLVKVNNVGGHRLASDLGLTGPGASPKVSGDLNPALTKTTLITDLNAGVGIVGLASGFEITVGDQTEIVDFTGATTVEDLLNAIEQTGLQIDAKISDDGSGLEIINRVAGKNFSIGENGGTLAGDLGLRTLTASTQLSSFDDGLGIPTFPGAVAGTTTRDLFITRRDATDITIDLSTAETVQDVLDAINAVDPGVLTATLATNGNGFVLQDTSGAGTLRVTTDAVSEALGIAGEQADPLQTLDGSDTNQLRSEGVFGLIVQLRDAISNDELRHVNRVGQALDDEISRFASVRGDVGSRLRTLSDTQQRIGDEQLKIAETLSETFDADITETITRLATVEASYQATLQVSSRLLNLNLLNLL